MTLKYSNYAIVGLVLGICSLVSWIIPVIGYTCSIVGLVFSSVSLTSDSRGKAIAGLILNIIGLSLVVSFTVIWLIFFR